MTSTASTEGSRAPITDPNLLWYRGVLQDLLDAGDLRREGRILVLCGGQNDREVLLSLGFTNVTVSNIDERVTEEDKAAFAPYTWDYQDAERLTYPDESFDLVMVHSGLHHLRCPQKGIQEMYRVASGGILAVEPLLSMMSRVGTRLGLGQVYEDAAVFDADFKYGGVENTNIPNYVYRFTPRDITRAVQTFSPIAEHEYRFWYAMRIHERVYRLRKRKIMRWAVKGMRSVLTALGSVFPPFANNFAFYVRKPRLPDELLPWLELSEGTIQLNRKYLVEKYDPVQAG